MVSAPRAGNRPKEAQRQAIAICAGALDWSEALEVSKAEEQLNLHLRAVGIEFVREHRFGAEAVGGPGKGLRQRLADAGLKDWRFDFAFPDAMLAAEVEGGGWSGGRHTRGKGFAEDLRKYDAAMRLGWTVYRCSPEMVKSGRAIDTIKALLEAVKD